METIDVFYRIFHDDLNPLTNQQDKAYYINHLKQTKPGNETINEIHKLNKHIEELSLQELKYYYYKDILRQSYQDIKRYLYQKTFSAIDNDIDVSKVIQNHQLSILNYLAILENDFLPNYEKESIYDISVDKTNVDILKLIYRILDDLLVYMERSFESYLKTSLEVSYQKQLWFVYHYQERVSVLISKVEELDIPKELKAILCIPLEKIRDNKVISLTYEYKDYLTMYIKVLWHVLHKNSVLNTYDLYSVLISLEFNTFKAFFFYKDYIKTQLSTCESEACKIVILEESQKKINTITVTYSRKLNPGLPSLKEQLLLWIKEELRFCEKRMMLRTTENNVVSKKLLKVSVPEISLITRLLYGTKFIEGSKRDSFQFLSNVFSTKNAKVISPESLSNHYYSVNESSKRSVQKILKKMLVSLDDMEGEL
ncbi:hypothetical protein [Aquimarina sp. RZ0]|uniref:hypothetical protein n=1 Tax=Aquimarina sp. RZ0 TaxID=2607730 RepID=UPI0011F29AA1|nr:hypothetical protein [Aquimarina sp. RZ0]KAA1245784.1 hypothetical protein F0000_10300 [Aquimarina sp. RZ0]